MPTYEYECLHCSHRFEVFQSMTDEPLGACPECGKRVRRLIHGGMGVIFKGSGFYSTDNRNGGKNRSEKDTEKSTPEPTKATTDTSSTSKKEPAKKES